MIPSHGLVSPIKTPHERATHHDDELCVGRRAIPGDARIAAFSPAAYKHQSSPCCGDPSGVSPKRASGNASRIRSPPPVLCKIPTLKHETPAWIKGEMLCLEESQQRGAVDPPSSEELVSTKEDSYNKTPIPAWKQKLLDRKNAKPSLPAWKQKLLEQKRAALETTTEASNDPPWKQELAARKKERLAKSEATENENLVQSGSDSFSIQNIGEGNNVDTTALLSNDESCASIGLDPPDATETTNFGPTFDDEVDLVKDNETRPTFDEEVDPVKDNDSDDDESSTCSYDTFDKPRAMSSSGSDSGLEAFLQDSNPIKTCTGTATTASSSSSSASETRNSENSSELPKSRLEITPADVEFAEEPVSSDIKTDGIGPTETEFDKEESPKTEDNVAEHTVGDGGFDDTSDSTDDSASEDDWDKSKSDGFSLSTSPASKDKLDKKTETVFPRSPKRRKVRRYALPLCDDFSSDGEEDALPPGVIAAVVPPMEFDDFSKEDFSATTDEDTLFLAGHYSRQRSVVKKATFADELTKDDSSHQESKIDRKKTRSKTSSKSSKGKSRRKSSKQKDKDETKTKSSKQKKSKKKEDQPPDDSVEEGKSLMEVKLDSHEKRKKKSTKSSTRSVKTEKSKAGKDSVKSKSSKKDREKKEKSSKKKDSKPTDSKKSDSKSERALEKEGTKKSKKAVKEKKKKSKQSSLHTMASF